MSDQDELKTLMNIHSQRLKILKRQQAMAGFNKVDPAITLEIEQIEGTIAQLRVELGESAPEQAEEKKRPVVGEPPPVHAASTGEETDRSPPQTAHIQFPATNLKDFGPAQIALLQTLYPDEQRVLVEKEFGGGFGGTRVFLVRPINHRGRQLAQQIVKIGPPGPLQKEQQNYEDHVGRSQPFVVAQVTNFAEHDGLGGIIYNFVGGGRLGETRTLEDYFQEGPVSAEAINETLENLLDKALGKLWYGETEPHTCFFDEEYGRHLVEYLRIKIRPVSMDGVWPVAAAPDDIEGYRPLRTEAIPATHAEIQPNTLLYLDGLTVTKIKPHLLKLHHPTQPGLVVKVEGAIRHPFKPGDSVTLRGEVRYNRSAKLAEIVTAAFASLPDAPVDPEIESVTWYGQTYPNPLHLYPKILSRTLDGKKSLVHGDLHLRNVLVDEAGQGWLIDFALVQERHNLYDFIKLETYIRQMVLAQARYDFSFADYVQFEHALLDEAAAGPEVSILQKASQVIRRVRQIATRYVKRDFAGEYWPALFLYNLAMLKYVENHGLKAARLAFGTAGVVGGALQSGGTKGPVKSVPTSPDIEKKPAQRSDKPLKKPKYDKSLFDRLVQQLLPAMNDPAERKALLESALIHAPVLQKIEWSGAAYPFTVRLVRQLDDYGDITPQRPALVLLLEEYKKWVGVDRQQNIDELIQELTVKKQKGYTEMRVNDNSQHHIPPNKIVRDCLEAAFDDETIRHFCQDYFPPVFRRIRTSDGLDQINRQLIRYCDQQMEMDYLWDCIRGEYPGQYQQFYGQWQTAMRAK